MCKLSFKHIFSQKNILFPGHQIIDIEVNFDGEKSPKQSSFNAPLVDYGNSGSLETVAHKLMISQTQVISHDLFMIYDLVTHYPNMQNVTCY